MLRYKSVFYTLDIPETLVDLSEEITPQAESLSAFASEIGAFLGPLNSDAIEAFPGYTFPQTVTISKSPILVGSLDPEVLAAQSSLPLDQLLEMQTSYANDFETLLLPVSAVPGTPTVWPIDQTTSDSLFKFLKNPPTLFGDPSKVLKFLGGMGSLKTAYLEKSSQIRNSLDKLLDQTSDINVSSAAVLVKLNLSTNVICMQKMNITMHDALLNGSSFAGFLRSNPLDILKGKLSGGFKV